MRKNKFETLWKIGLFLFIVYSLLPKSDKEPIRVTSYSMDDISIEGTNELFLHQYPNFASDAWLEGINPYSDGGFYGQCTWFVWGRFYEIYGYSPEFLGNGNENVDELLEKHPDKFVRSDTPIVGSIGSSDYEHNHVWLVVGIDEDGNGCTIQEGNLDLVTNTWEESLTDWRQVHYTWQDLEIDHGKVVYANPIYN